MLLCRTFSGCKTATLWPSNSNSHIPLSFIPGNHHSIFFKSLITLVPNISGIIQHLSFCDWLISLSIMSSSFIYVVACVRISFFLDLYIIWYLYTTFCSSIDLSVNNLVASTFWLLWIIAAMNMGVQISLQDLAFSSYRCIYPKVEELEHMEILIF